MSPDRDAIALDEPKHRAGAEPAYAAARVAGPLVTAVFPLIVAAIAVGVWQTLGMALGLGRDGVTIELEISIPLVVLLLGDPVSRPRRRIPEPASDLGGDRDRAHTRALSSFAAVIVAISAARRSSELADRLAGVSRGRWCCLVGRAPQS